ncbi:MAG: DUF429 domain-containing protein [Actinomycetota bacterium]|nr:DUF429 domain-containing protein [Actinomycetota bacterium]
MVTAPVTRVLGVDGCPGGWVAALVDTAAGTVRWHLAPDAAAVLGLADREGAAATGVDIPIGLATGSVRAADTAVRAALSPRGSSVFNAPVRSVLPARTYAEACALSRAACGKAISLQTWNITAKIAEWDAVITPALQRRVVEVHPELSFRAMTGRVLAAKKTAAGRAGRLEALACWLAGVSELVATRPRPARPDDALDALAAAWSALRWARGEAGVLPVVPQLDERGRWMEIVT